MKQGVNFDDAVKTINELGPVYLQAFSRDHDTLVRIVPQLPHIDNTMQARSGTRCYIYTGVVAEDGTTGSLLVTGGNLAPEEALAAMKLLTKYGEDHLFSVPDDVLKRFDGALTTKSATDKKKWWQFWKRLTMTTKAGLKAGLIGVVALLVITVISQYLPPALVFVTCGIEILIYVGIGCLAGFFLSPPRAADKAVRAGAIAGLIGGTTQAVVRVVINGALELDILGVIGGVPLRVGIAIVSGVIFAAPTVKKPEEIRKPGLAARPATLTTPQSPPSPGRTTLTPHPPSPGRATLTTQGAPAGFNINMIGTFVFKEEVGSGTKFYVNPTFVKVITTSVGEWDKKLMISLLILQSEFDKDFITPEMTQPTANWSEMKLETYQGEEMYSITYTP